MCEIIIPGEEKSSIQEQVKNIQQDISKDISEINKTQLGTTESTDEEGEYVLGLA